MTRLTSTLRTTIRTAHRVHARLLLLAANAAVGGQAVMEGVMMRGPSHWAIALRRYNGEIVEVHRTHSSFARRHRWARVPVVRGAVALGESLVIGFKALGVSAHYAAEYAEARYAAEEAQGKPHEHRHHPVPVSELLVLPENVVHIDAHRHGADGSVPADDTRSGEAVAATAVAVRSATSHTPETDDPDSDASPESLKRWQIGVAFVLAIGFSIALFKLLPLGVTLLTGIDRSNTGPFVLFEGCVRVSIFMGYLYLIGRLPDMRRVFQYHSAEHKAINAWENGHDLTPATVNRESRIHVRCGTAFLLWVFAVGLIVFGIFGKVVGEPTILQLVASRVIFLPLIAGVSFELIKFAGRHPRNRLLRGILAPGLWMQRLTTRECTDDQCEVAIRSLHLVLEREYPEAKDEADALHRAEEEGAVEVMA